MTELKPCPFCGATGEILSDGKREWALFEHKDSCLFPNIHKHEIPAYDFAAWNTRTAYEMDGWFYLPKPKRRLFNYTTGLSFDDLSLKATGTADVYALTSAIQEWQIEALNKRIVERICEVFKPERTCKNYDTDNDAYFTCSACESSSVTEFLHDGCDIPNYCPNCGAKVIEE